MLLTPFAIQANVELPESVSTQSLIASIAKSNLTEEENTLIDSFVESRIRNNSKVVLNDRSYRHNNNTEHRSHSNNGHCPNQQW